MRAHVVLLPALEVAALAGIGHTSARKAALALKSEGRARAGAPADLLEALEAWSADQMQQAA